MNKHDYIYKQLLISNSFWPSLSPGLALFLFSFNVWSPNKIFRVDLVRRWNQTKYILKWQSVQIFSLAWKKTNKHDNKCHQNNWIEKTKVLFLFCDFGSVFEVLVRIVEHLEGQVEFGRRLPVVQALHVTYLVVSLPLGVVLVV